MKIITGTQFNYYLICHRKLWLFSSGINMEHTSDLVYEGKLIHENSYPQRPEHHTEIEMDGIKIDFYDPKRKIIHEIKKSDSYEQAHEWQIKYYIYIMQKNGMEGMTGVLEYPKMKETRVVEFSKDDYDEINRMVAEITQIAGSVNCPEKKSFSKCRNCAYTDFCWSGETNDEDK
jgi:CRISPR-associated exonuclease Cas4